MGAAYMSCRYESGFLIRVTAFKLSAAGAALLKLL